MPIAPRNALTGRPIRALTVVGLGLVLLTFAVLLVAGSIIGSRAADDAAHAGRLASAYLNAQDALSREDRVEELSSTRPDAALRVDFARAAADFGTAMTALERDGSPRDRKLAAGATQLHDRYAGAMRDAFAAAARGDEAAVEAIDEERMDPAQEDLQRLINGVGPQYAVEQLTQLDELARDERRLRDVTFVVVPIGAALYLLLIAVFAAYRRRIDRQLDAAAHTDHLTGLRNHRGLHTDLEALPEGGVVALLDVVGLKQVNDRRGHLAGDALLRSVADALRDAAAGQGTAYRIGGDEFALVLPGCGEPEGIAVVEAAAAQVRTTHEPGVRAGVAAGEARLLPRASTALLGARRSGEPVVTEPSRATFALGVAA